MIGSDNSKIAKIYAWLLVLVPVLSQYQVGPLDLDVIIMAGFFCFYLLYSGRVALHGVNKQILGIICYIVVITTINIVIGRKYSPVSSIVVRAGKYCLYLFIVFFVGNRFITYETMMRTYRTIVYTATIYIIIQTVAYYGAGITLPNKLGGSSHSNNGAEVGRLRSFYSEPAAYGYVTAPFIACSLFGVHYRDGKNRNAVDALFATVGIILSTSGQGIIVTAVIWGLWVLLQIINGGFRNVGKLALLVSAVVASLVLYKTGILEFALGRFDAGSESGAVSARMSGYETLTLLSPFQRIFGAGYGNYVVENTFDLNVFYDVVNYSSIAQFLFTQGILGTGLWCVFFCTVFWRGTACSRVLVIAMLVLSIGGCPMLGITCPLWLTLMCVQLPNGQFSGRPADT